MRRPATWEVLMRGSSRVCSSSIGGREARSPRAWRTSRGRSEIARASARELGSLTAQARLSATILGLLPIGFFLFLSVIARRDLEAAYETPTGVAAIGFGFALQGAAYVWIRHLLRVEP
ncbi:MAG TPA: hypothetical protein VGJ99_01625 [Actinomycetota bacterium]